METVTYRYSAARLVLLGLGGLILTALSVAIASHLLPVAPGSKEEAAGWFGSVFFLAATAVAFSRLRRVGTDVLVLTATGITDMRIMPDEMPWAGILSIAVLEVHRQKFLNVRLAPAVEQKLPQTRASRMARELGRRMGVAGMAIGTQGLDVDFATLRDECLRRLEQARRPSSPA